MKRAAVLLSLIALMVLVPSSAYSQDALSGNWKLPVPWGGSWYWTTTTPNGAIPAVVTYHIDGSVTGADISMFGGTANNPYRYSPFHGTWERRGWGNHEFAGTSLYLRFDPTTNKLVGIARVRAQFAFVQDFDHIAGTMRLDVLPCPTPATCPDPLAKDAAWQPYNPEPLPNEFPFQATRIRVVPITD